MIIYNYYIQGLNSCYMKMSNLKFNKGKKHASEKKYEKIFFNNFLFRVELMMT